MAAERTKPLIIDCKRCGRAHRLADGVGKRARLSRHHATLEHMRKWMRHDEMEPK